MINKNPQQKKLYVKVVSEQIYSHLLGEEHTPRHRKIAGVIIIIIGVGFVKITSFIPYVIIHFFGDAIGYLVHGVGCLPFIEGLKPKDNEAKKENESDIKEKNIINNEENINV